MHSIHHYNVNEYLSSPKIAIYSTFPIWGLTANTGSHPFVSNKSTAFFHHGVSSIDSSQGYSFKAFNIANCPLILFYSNEGINIHTGGRGRCVYNRLMGIIKQTDICLKALLWKRIYHVSKQNQKKEGSLQYFILVILTYYLWYQ